MDTANTALPSSDHDDDSFETRWARWLAKGDASDRRAQRAVYAIAVGIGGGLVAWGVFAVYAG